MKLNKINLSIYSKNISYRDIANRIKLFLYYIHIYYRKKKIFTIEMHLKPNLVWFGLVSLFNGISTFVGYLMPKSSF